MTSSVSTSATALVRLATEQLSVSLTGEGMILGTFQYMAPEQVEGQDADVRTDIFAFGAVLFEMLTGRPAFHARPASDRPGNGRVR